MGSITQNERNQSCIKRKNENTKHCIAVIYKHIAVLYNSANVKKYHSCDIVCDIIFVSLYGDNPLKNKHYAESHPLPCQEKQCTR